MIVVLLRERRDSTIKVLASSISMFTEVRGLIFGSVWDYLENGTFVVL